MEKQSEKKVKVGRYSMFIPNDNGEYIVYNGLTGTIIHVNDEHYIMQIKAMLNNYADKAFDYDPNNEMHKCFKEHSVIVDEDVNEYELAVYSYEQRIVRDTSLTLILITSRQCNLRCVYCYEDHRNNHMSASVYESLLLFINDSLSKRTYSGVNISLFGGEPFIQFDEVINFLQNAKKLCADYGVPFIVGATTNFALVTPTRFDELAKNNCVFYQVTLDGLAETHDKYRPKVNGSGSFAKILENLKYAKQTCHNFNIVIRTNFNREIAAQAQEFYEFIKNEFNDERFAVHFEGIKELGGANDGAIEILDAANEADISAEISKIVAALKIKNSAQEFFTQPFQGVCYASKHNTFVIDHDGTIRKCTVKLDDNQNDVGKLSADGRLQLIHNKHSCWVCKQSKLTEKCQKCKILPICFGGRCVVGQLDGERRDCMHEAKVKTLTNLLKYAV
ncbi:radical SAM/SPASM domain-containing protein [Clostridia bacterium]|nr:radical SAM/SPASM domain-containing protein [Clostridia bacterium]